MFVTVLATARLVCIIIFSEVVCDRTIVGVHNYFSKAVCDSTIVETINLSKNFLETCLGFS